MSPGNTGFMADDRGFFKQEKNYFNIQNNYSTFVFVVGTQGFVVKNNRGQFTQGYSFLTSLA